MRQLPRAASGTQNHDSVRKEGQRRTSKSLWALTEAISKRLPEPERCRGHTTSGFVKLHQPFKPAPGGRFEEAALA